MNKIDFNCFIGGWPFHKVRRNTFAALRKLHGEGNIDSGYVSSTNAIFYNDPYEADLDLACMIKSYGQYKHIMTINPASPGYDAAIKRGVRDLHIEGVRVFPGFHGYSLEDDNFKSVCAILTEIRKPLFLTLRMEDERVTHMFHPRSISLENISAFLSREKNLNVLICNIRLAELVQLRDMILDRPGIYADCSGLKDTVAPVETLDECGLTSRLVYGSCAPIFCFKSSLMVVEQSTIPQYKKDEIFSAKGFLGVIKA